MDVVDVPSPASMVVTATRDYCTFFSVFFRGGSCGRDFPRTPNPARDAWWPQFHGNHVTIAPKYDVPAFHRDRMQIQMTAHFTREDWLQNTESLDEEKQTG